MTLARWEKPVDVNQPALVYRNNGTDLREHIKHDGWHCYLLSQASSGILCIDGTMTAPMYNVEFDDGIVLSAFADELEIPDWPEPNVDDLDGPVAQARGI